MNSCGIDKKKNSDNFLWKFDVIICSIRYFFFTANDTVTVTWIVFCKTWDDGIKD